MFFFCVTFLTINGCSRVTNITIRMLILTICIISTSVHPVIRARYVKTMEKNTIMRCALYQNDVCVCVCIDLWRVSLGKDLVKVQSYTQFSTISNVYPLRMGSRDKRSRIKTSE